MKKNKKEFEKIGLKEIQCLFLKRFSVLHNFLLNHNINYFAVGGTALGAVRHGGFIPWDDDIDIGMLRKDYEKFLQECKELDNNLFSVSGCRVSRDDVDFGHTRVMIKGTYTINNIKESYNHCLYIDIFPFDFVAKNVCLEKKVERRKKTFTRLLDIKSKKRCSTNFKTILLYLLKIIISPFSSHFIAKKYDNFSSKYYFCGNKNFVVNNFGVYSYDKEKVPIEYVLNTKFIKFGETQLLVSSKVNDYLMHIYGKNFMTPVNSRNIKSDYFILCDKTIKNEISNSKLINIG